MRCPYPLNIKTPGQDDPRIRSTVPCGKCIHCLTNKRTAWTFRIKQHLKGVETASFITLTYDQNNVPLVYSRSARAHFMTLRKKDLRLFMKKLRRQNEKYTTSKITYYAVGEYGTETFRPHYHLLIFNLDNMVNVEKTWSKGNIVKAECNEATIHYVTKHQINREVYRDYVEKEFAWISNGIGKRYVEKNSEYHKKNRSILVTHNGSKIAMPRYYKEKIFNKLELKYLSNLNREKMEEREEKLKQEILATGANYSLYQINNLIQKEERMRKHLNKKNQF